VAKNKVMGIILTKRDKGFRRGVDTRGSLGYPGGSEKNTQKALDDRRKEKDAARRSQNKHYKERRSTTGARGSRSKGGTQEVTLREKEQKSIGR